MATLKIKATKVLKKTLQAEKDGFKIICHEGGSRSSKTWSIFQFFLLKAIAGERFTLTIVREKLTWIKSTVLKDFAEITRLYGITITPEVNFNRAEQLYYINGSEFAFFGLDYTEKLHGRKQDWFWMNEVMECSKSEFDQLEMRTKVGGIVDYNPANDEHWVFELARRPDVIFIKSTMLDNPFLAKPIVQKIRSYEPTEENIKAGTADSYMWDVYGLGKRAKLVGVIFDNWDVVDIPETARLIGCGLDFGYSNHPTALVALYVDSNELYFDELLYKTGLTNQAIAEEFGKLGIDKNLEIFCDSAEPKSIDEIAALGWKALPATKGPDSIKFGIDLLKSFRVHMSPRSINLEKEARKYKWATDRSGKTTNVPVDEFNHLLDAGRYVTSMKMSSKKEPVMTIDFY